MFESERGLCILPSTCKSKYQNSKCRKLRYYRKACGNIRSWPTESCINLRKVYKAMCPWRRPYTNISTKIPFFFPFHCTMETIATLPLILSFHGIFMNILAKILFFKSLWLSIALKSFSYKRTNWASYMGIRFHGPTNNEVMMSFGV